MEETPPDFELEALAVLAEHLNPRRARAGLSQPALHTRLRRLAELVGAPLSLQLVALGSAWRSSMDFASRRAA